MATVYVNLPDLTQIPERDRWKVVNDTLREILRAAEREHEQLRRENRALQKRIKDLEGA